MGIMMIIGEGGMSMGGCENNPKRQSEQTSMVDAGRDDD
jgi:hypothetical protein